MLNRSSDFLRVFSNIPVGIRKEIVYVDEEYGPMSWLVVFIEVQAKSKMAEKILDRLAQMKII